MKKILFFIATLIIFACFSSIIGCDTIITIITTPPKVFIVENLRSVNISGELIISGNFDGDIYKQKHIKIDAISKAQARYIITAFGVKKYSLDFYKIPLSDTGSHITMWFSQSNQVGKSVKIRIYDKDYSSRFSVGIENASISFRRSKKTPELKEVLYFKIESDIDFIFDKAFIDEKNEGLFYTFHKGSYLSFNNYEYKKSE